MSQGLINKSTLNDIATAINTRLGETDTMKPSEMADKINSLPLGLLIDSKEDLWRNASLDSNSKYLDYNELSTTGRELPLPTSDPQITGGAPCSIGELRGNGTIRLMRDNYRHYGIYTTFNYNNGLYNTITVTLYNSDGQSTSATKNINNPNKFSSTFNTYSRGLVNTYIVSAQTYGNPAYYANLIVFIHPSYTWGDDLEEYLTVLLEPSNTRLEMAFHYPLDSSGNAGAFLGCSYKEDAGHYLIGIHTGTSAKTLDFTLGSGVDYTVTIRDSQSSDYENCSYFVEPFDEYGCYYGCCLDEMFLITSETNLDTPLTSLSTSKRKRSQVKRGWTGTHNINGVSERWGMMNDPVYNNQVYIRYSVVDVSTGQTTTTYLCDLNDNIGEPCMYDIEALEAVNEIHGWVYNSSTQKYEKDGASISLMGIMSDEVMLVCLPLTSSYAPVSYDEDLDCFVIYDGLSINGSLYIVDNKVLSTGFKSIMFRDGMPDNSIGLQGLPSIVNYYLNITLKGE